MFNGWCCLLLQYLHMDTDTVQNKPLSGWIVDIVSLLNSKICMIPYTIRYLIFAKLGPDGPVVSVVRNRLVILNIGPFTFSTILFKLIMHAYVQCCGSGSESGSTGSTCFWVSRIRILLSSLKNNKKNLDSHYFVTLFYFLSLKNDVNVPSKSNKQKIF
jgi:hypothetical protein